MIACYFHLDKVKKIRLRIAFYIDSQSHRFQLFKKNAISVTKRRIPIGAEKEPF